MPSWNHDGTQEPVPPPPMADPLSGKYDAEAVRVRVVEPAMPDIEAVREAMASVLDEDSELVVIRRPLEQPKGELEIPIAMTGTAGANDPDAGDGGTGVGPEAATPPAGVPAAMPPVMQAPRRRIPLGALRRLSAARAGIPLQRGTRARPMRRSWWSPGLGTVVLLLLVMAVLGIVMLASLIDTITSLFE